MAIIIRGKSECPLCGKALAEGQRLIGTQHFIPDPEDPLWRFSDAGMHYDCFQQWPLREQFVAKYNNTLGRQVWGNGTRHHMQDDGVIQSVPAGR
jgi:hypothetical protein